MSMPRLNGAYALSLDSAPWLENDRYPIEVNIVLDRDRLFAALGLDRDERRYYLANKVSGIPRRRLAGVLNWPASRVAAIQVRLSLKLRRQRGTLCRSDFIIPRGGNSSAPFYEDGPTWCLSYLGDEFDRVMDAEKLSIRPEDDRAREGRRRL